MTYNVFSGTLNLTQLQLCLFVDASLAHFSLDKAFKRKSVKVEFLFRGIHSDPQHSAVGCKVVGILFPMTL